MVSYDVWLKIAYRNCDYFLSNQNFQYRLISYYAMKFLIERNKCEQYEAECSTLKDGNCD